MPTSTLPKWTKRNSFVALFALAAASAGANGILDVHLDIVPRTPLDQTRVDTVTQPAVTFDAPEQFEGLSAGAASGPALKNRDAFSQPSANMDFDRELDFLVGKGLFKKLWVSSPSSTKASDGLGPLYNARSCQRCHVQDGRGHPPEGADDNAISMLVRVSVPGGDTYGIPGYHATQPHPVYGAQLQDFALPGLASEIQLDITYDEVTVALSDGEFASLRKPTVTPKNPGYGAYGETAMFSARVAPQMIGLGLLEAIPTHDIMAGADPEDADGDGISGRPNIVWSAEFQHPMLGRFGHKAGMPTVHEQSAGAFSGDIGISSPLFPDPWGDCTADQSTCRSMPHGHADARIHEIDQTGLDLVTFYSRNLAVPQRARVDDPVVLHGKQVFFMKPAAQVATPRNL